MEYVKWPQRNFVFHPSLKESFPVAPEMYQEVFDDGLSYKPNSNDIFVCTYPKSGTTWMTCALLMMRNGGKPIEDGRALHHMVPFLEYGGKSAVEAVTEQPRIIKSHAMFQMIPMNPDAKYIYIARNPKDCVVSFYFHTLGFLTSEFANGKFDDFFDMFMAGRAEFGDYFESVGEWYEESKKRKNICFLLYEDLKEDFEKEYLKIAEFLEYEWKEKLLENDKMLLRKVVEHSSFRSMKNRKLQYTPKPRSSESDFIRKGEVSDWKNYMSEKQSQLVDEKLKEAGKKYVGFDKIWDKHICM